MKRENGRKRKANQKNEKFNCISNLSNDNNQKLSENEWKSKWNRSKNTEAAKMNCMSVQQEKKSYQRGQAYQQSNTASRVGLRSCLRGEIEDTECKIELLQAFL